MSLSHCSSLSVCGCRCYSVQMQDLTVHRKKDLRVDEEVKLFKSVWEGAKKGSSVAAFKKLLDVSASSPPADPWMRVAADSSLFAMASVSNILRVHTAR